MDDSGWLDAFLAGSVVAGLFIVFVFLLPVFLFIAILVRYFQATADMRKLLKEVQDIRDIVATDFEAKYRRSPQANSPQLPPGSHPPTPPEYRPPSA